MFFAPFVHPRRDKYLSRARHLAAFSLALAQGCWFVAFVWAIQNGTQLSPAVSILGLVGMFFVASRAGRAGEIALGFSDRLHKLDWAPGAGEIVRRVLLEFILPFGILTLAFIFRESSSVVYASLIAGAVLEAGYRALNLATWRKASIHPAVLASLLVENPSRALAELDAAKQLEGVDFEATVLAISGISLRKNDLATLKRLDEAISQRSLPPEGSSEYAIAERTASVVRADIARMEDPENCAEQEALALRLLPVGHPRRLALGLFVATAALDQKDPASAAKALLLLHSRDVVISTGRVLVNWLLVQAADRMEDANLGAASRQAQKTFNLPRIARGMTIDSAREQTDPYAKWIRRAHEDLASEG